MPNRASMRSQVGNSRTRTTSSAATVLGVQLSRSVRLRQETHCGQGEYAAHRNADAGVTRTHRHHLLIQQRRGRPVGAAVLLGQGDPALREVEHDAGGHVVEVDESRLRRQRTAPRGVHRESRGRRSPNGPSPAARGPARRRRRTGRRAARVRRRPGWPARRNRLPPRRRRGHRRVPATGSRRRRRAVAPVRRTSPGLRGARRRRARDRVRVGSSRPVLEILPMRGRKPYQPLLLDVDGGQLRLGDHRRLGVGSARTERTS